MEVKLVDMKEELKFASKDSGVQYVMTHGIPQMLK
jgi:hypothetical protein